MPFAYYNRLSRNEQRIYRASDEIHAIRVRQPSEFHSLVTRLEKALSSESRPATELASRRLVTALTERLGVSRLKVRVMAARPSSHWGELHGVYTPRKGRGLGEIVVWMRTAKRRQVVAFRTFLRTVLHELCHHLDYELLDLEESFHTEGFYKRESSLFHQLAPKR